MTTHEAEYKKLEASFDLRIGVNPTVPAGADIVHSSAAAYELIKGYSQADREIMLVVMVDSKHAVMSIETHSIGTLDSSAVYPREIFRSLLLKNASAFILVHNHPTGDPTPSGADKQITEDIVRGSILMGIRLLDHTILGDGRFYSMADSGILDDFVLANRTSQARPRI